MSDEIELPKYKYSMSITHNEHNNYYEKASDTIDQREYTVDNFLSQQDMDKCIELNELWIIQWYPDTPIGFHVAIGSTYDKMIEKANEEEK